MGDENNQEIKEGEERRENSGPTTTEQNTQPVVPAGDPNSTSPNTRVGQPANNQNPASGVETPGQNQPVEKNRIDVPDVSHAGEGSVEKPSEADKAEDEENADEQE